MTNPRTIPDVVAQYVRDTCSAHATIHPIQHCRFMVSDGRVCMYLYTDLLRERIVDIQVD